MIVTPKIFVHIPKNAGLTIRYSQILKDRIIIARPDIHKSADYTKAVKTQMDNFGDHHGWEHARWRDLKPTITSAYDSFAIVRNPWDRVISRYFFAKKVLYHEKNSDHYGKTDYCDCSSLESFLEERHKWGNIKYMWHRAIRGWYPAFDHVTDKNGKIKCDIMRLEYLNSDICSYLKIPEMTRARNVTALNEGSYKDLYTKKTIQIVADWYQKDIDTWGFDFDTAAQKNYWRI